MKASSFQTAFVTIIPMLGFGCTAVEHCEYYPDHCMGEVEEGDGPESPVLELSISQVKQFQFSWSSSPDVDYYHLLESAEQGEDYTQVMSNIVGESLALTVPLHLRTDASYKLQACNGSGCSESAAVRVPGSLAPAVGYFKASNTSEADNFGQNVALSGDGNTLAVAAWSEDSSANGNGGNQADDSAPDSGAVYVFVRNAADQWSQQAYLKAPNTDGGDHFGWSVVLSGDGNTLVVGAPGEDSSATGIADSQSQSDNSALQSGAVYVFARDPVGQWSQQAYMKASNTQAYDSFGETVSLSADGNTLAVGAYTEDSGADGIGGDATNESAFNAGAVYVFFRSGPYFWSQQAYVKASNSGAGDYFGRSVALSGDGNTLAVGAASEDSNAQGVNGSQNDDSADDTGAVYVFERNALDQWAQQAYVKATASFVYGFGTEVALSETGTTLAVASTTNYVYMFTRNTMGQWSQRDDIYDGFGSLSGTAFGSSVALNGDGSVLSVGAHSYDSSESAKNSGAAYVFVRDTTDHWLMQTVVTPPNPTADDSFGDSLALSSDGNMLAVGASKEDSSATGIGGDQTYEVSPDAGAVYLY